MEAKMYMILNFSGNQQCEAGCNTHCFGDCICLHYEGLISYITWLVIVLIPKLTQKN